MLDYCQTPADHAWPRFFISCPTKGKAYGRADPHGFIQLDVSAQVGSGMLAAYKLTGNPRYREAVEHWADLLAEHCDLRPGQRPWNRYANPEDAKWDTRQTAGVSLVLQFLDDVIRLGHTGKDDALVKARDAGERYLRDVLLPEWNRDPTFGHHFWDWLNPVATCAVPCYTSHYMMNRREAFPDWKTDVRNIVSLFFCRSSVDPESAGGVYSGALGVPGGEQLLRQVAAIPVDGHGRDAGPVRACWPTAPGRGNRPPAEHPVDLRRPRDGRGGRRDRRRRRSWPGPGSTWPIPGRCVPSWKCSPGSRSGSAPAARTTSCGRPPWCQTVRYGKGRIAYRTFDAVAPCEDVLRLAFVPKSVTADGQPLQARGGRCRRTATPSARWPTATAW